MRPSAAAVVFSLLASQAQQTPTPPPPPTDVYLADLPATGQIAQVIDISNNADYDNQPSFTPDGKSVLFTSKRDGQQTDIYRYDIDRRTLTRLTNTRESEYSPLVTPDGRTFSAVRVEADGTQRLWRFDLDGTHPRLVLEQIKPVGYHVWIDATHLGLFVLGGEGRPNTLQIAETTGGTAMEVANDIGRGLRLRPATRTLTFVSKATTPWQIKEIDPATRVTSTITAVVEGSEDFVWDTIDGGEVLFMASGSKLFVWRAGAAFWREYADFRASGLTKLTRIAVRPGSARPHFALVSEKGTG